MNSTHGTACDHKLPFVFLNFVPACLRKYFKMNMFQLGRIIQKNELRPTALMCIWHTVVIAAFNTREKLEGSTYLGQSKQIQGFICSTSLLLGTSAIIKAFW